MIFKTDGSYFVSVEFSPFSFRVIKDFLELYPNGVWDNGGILDTPFIEIECSDKETADLNNQKLKQIILNHGIQILENNQEIRNEN